MNEQPALAQMTVQYVLDRWPQTVLVFQRRAMACVGCVVAAHATIAEAAEAYHMPVESLVSALAKAIDSSEPY